MNQETKVVISHQSIDAEAAVCLISKIGAFAYNAAKSVFEAASDNTTVVVKLAKGDWDSYKNIPGIENHYFENTNIQPSEPLKFVFFTEMVQDTETGKILLSCDASGMPAISATLSGTILGTDIESVHDEERLRSLSYLLCNRIVAVNSEGIVVGSKKVKLEQKEEISTSYQKTRSPAGDRSQGNYMSQRERK